MTSLTWAGIAGGQTGTGAVQSGNGRVFAQTASGAVVRMEQHQYVAVRQSDQSEFSKAVHELVVYESGEIDMDVSWIFFETAIAGSDKSRLAENYSTITSHITVSKEGSDYRVKRSGDMVQIHGLFHNKKINKSIAIDNYPLYTNPTIGLKGFIRSGEKNSRFWLLHPEKPEVLRMKVELQGDEIIDINGRRFEARRLKWGLTGIKSLFFSETYWFDKEKAIFLKNVSREGIVTEIVSKLQE
jgi:hypothetical protein